MFFLVDWVALETINGENLSNVFWYNAFLDKIKRPALVRGDCTSLLGAQKRQQKTTFCRRGWQCNTMTYLVSLKSSPQSEPGVSDGIKTCVIAVTWVSLFWLFNAIVQVYEGQYGEKADVWSRLGFGFMPWCDVMPCPAWLPVKKHHTNHFLVGMKLVSFAGANMCNAEHILLHNLLVPIIIRFAICVHRIYACMVGLYMHTTYVTMYVCHHYVMIHIHVFYILILILCFYVYTRAFICCCLNAMWLGLKDPK